MLAAMVGAAAGFLSQSYGAPVMLLALLIGMALHGVADQSDCARGLGFASQTLLRWGVALMGLRLDIQDVSVLGWVPVAAVAGLVLATLGAGCPAVLPFRATAGLRAARGRFGRDLRGLRGARHRQRPAPPRRPRDGYVAW